MSRGYITATRDGILLNLRVSPGAKRSSIEGPYGESSIRLRIAAPPVNGRANTEDERFLAELLGISSSNSTVARGAKSRDKTVRVRGVGEDEVRKILSSHLR